MASAVASSTPAAVSYGWLGPRVSFGRDPVAASAAVADHGLALSSDGCCKADQASAVSKEFIDFEFSFGGSGTMLPADQLFADGKLLPLRPQPAEETAPEVEVEQERQSAPEAATPAAPEMVKTLRPSMPEAFDPYVFSPKAPTCSSRWRELLRLRKVQTPQKPSASPSPSPSPLPATPSRASNSSAARSLKLLLQRNGGRASGAAVSDLSAAPLLRDSSDSEASLSLASSRFSMSSSSSSSAHDHDDFPRHSIDSVDLTPKPRIRLVRSQPQRHCHPPASAPPRATPSSQAAPPRSTQSPTPPRATQSPARRRPATPPPPSVASVDSPRMNSSGKIVFQGLERSSSSPAGSAHALRSRSRVMDRSYSAPVVLNVPVCSRPSFGFFKDKKDVAAKDAAARLRSSLGRKTAAHPAGSSVSCRDLGASK